MGNLKQIVYIASTGYSGSTLLESILGTCPDINNVGEVSKLHFYQSCTCGNNFSSCPFWIAVADKLNISVSEIGQQHIPGQRNRSNLFIKALHDAFIVLGTPVMRHLWSNLSSEIYTFQKGCEKAIRLFEAICTTSNKSIIIDSSKDPILLKHMYVLRPDLFKVIHLVRDARAVSYSVVKNYDRDGLSFANEFHGQRTTYKDGASFWEGRNAKIELAIRNIPEKSKLFLRYEDLCNDLEKSCRQISEFIGIEVNPVEDFDLSTQHTISGNPWRKMAKTMTVSANHDWKEKVDASNLAIVDKLAGMRNRKYGYV